MPLGAIVSDVTRFSWPFKEPTNIYIDYYSYHAISELNDCYYVPAESVLNVSQAYILLSSDPQNKYRPLRDNAILKQKKNFKQ